MRSGAPTCSHVRDLGEAGCGTGKGEAAVNCMKAPAPLGKARSWRYAGEL